MSAYRSEIDGMRAVAVVSIVLFHANQNWLPGGFLGVDIFFVISGYLITNIIMRDISSGGFSIASFYERRARRILPALFAVIFASMPIAYLFLFPHELREFAMSIMASVLFVSNIFFYKTINYFANNVELYPFVHMWSLSVEEQYYLIFPLFIKVASIRQKYTFTILAISFCVSFTCAYLLSSIDRTFDFYMLPTRYWEICAGALIVFFPAAMWSRLSESLAVVGLVAVTGSILFIDQTANHPGMITLFPVAGSVLLIRYAHADTAVGRMLAWAPVSGIGLISYSVYLWHQPIFAFAMNRTEIFDGTAQKIGLACFVFGLGYLSWRFVERPFRDKCLFSGKDIFAYAGCAAALTIFLGCAIEGFNGFPSRWPAATAVLDQSISTDFAAESRCSGQATPISPDEACVYNAPTKTKIALWGDSHASAIAVSLAANLAKFEVGLRQFSQLGCIPVGGLRVASNNGDSCVDFNRETLNFLLKSKDIETFILVARWPMYLDGSKFDNKEGGHTGIGDSYAFPVGVSSSRLDDPLRIDAIQAQFKTEIAAILAAGKRVVLVDPIPEIGWRVPEQMQRELFRSGGARPKLITIKYSAYEQRRRTTANLFHSVDGNENILEIATGKLFCEPTGLGRCIAEKDGRPLYSDDNHLTRLGADMLSREIVAELAAKKWL
jgi:putative solute:sodium symporter small subunit